MGSSRLPWLLFIISFTVFSGMVDVYSQCLENQKTILLQFKHSLIFDASLSSKLVLWNSSMDCCSWAGVTCSSGHVTALDLNGESITGGVDNSSNLFHLQYLQSLNLAYNTFINSEISPEFGKLANLTYLNMSSAGFSGQIPIEISRLTKLVTLDISYNNLVDSSLKLVNPNLRTLVRNLSSLEELYLDGVNISSNGYEWCQALSSSLPNLRVLSFSFCNLFGPIDSSLAKLRHLSVIRLSGNQLLEGSLHEFLPQNGSLQTLILSDTNFSGKLPDSIGNLKRLSRIELSSCNFNGTIPSSMADLTQLVYLDLSHNKFTGQIPSHQWEGLRNLEYLDLRDNSLNGSIPLSLFSLQSLQVILLSNNQFDGPLNEFPSVSSHLLDTLDLSNNKLEGPVPMSVFKLRGLIMLQLSYNNFNGTLDYSSMMQSLANLTILDLSFNNLSIITTGNESASTPSHQFYALRLASCKLSAFPNLKNMSNLIDLNLSSNQLRGEIPSWVWNTVNGDFSQLNLSNNMLVDFEKPLPQSLPNLYFLDLHSNHLQGQIPILTSSAMYLDYSNNNFSSIIPDDIGNNITRTYFFSLSSNSLTGTIPKSICNAPYLKVLDLSYNSLNGPIPSCLFQMSENLGVLDLQSNRLSGTIPDTFPVTCKLQTLDFNGNLVEGPVPRTLDNCAMLEVLNLGNNRIADKFPCWLNNSPKLRVLILRANKFQGSIKCTGSKSNLQMLQIVDLAFNNFSGNLPSRWFYSWKAMMADVDALQTKADQLYYRFAMRKYQDVRTMTTNGLELKLVKIFTFFPSIDFSSNNFEGDIPEVMGKLKSLHGLNMSMNAFTGQIPTSLGNLSHLESLDLSHNNFLMGTIPKSICNASYLQVLDLSYNSLNGTIPSCLIQMSEYLGVLNLQSNHFSGTIPDTFPVACNLQTLDFNGNLVEGPVPRTLDNCATLEVLNLGNNRIADNFPCWLNNSPKLRVLILRANKFQGSIKCAGSKSNLQTLQIVDLAFNNFSGNLPSRCFYSWKAMMADVDALQTKADHLHYGGGQVYYQDAVTVTLKGLQLELVKILTIYISIDFSSNNFEGDIPEVIGKLKSLHVLNMSLNAFTGQIPTSLGNLSQLESLDLSQNKLTGNIPNGLTTITFLSFLDLSFNQLAGTIPRGNQFETFANTSYLGNRKLCGSPLSITCPTAEGETPTTTTKDAHSNSDTTINWDYISVEMGFFFGLGIVIGPLIFWKRWRNWYNLQVDLLLSKIFRLQYQGRNNYRRRPRRITGEGPN